MYTKVLPDAKVIRARDSSLRERLATLAFTYDFTFELRILALDFALLCLGLRHANLSRVVRGFKWERELVFRYRLQHLLVMFVCLAVLAGNSRTHAEIRPYIRQATICAPTDLWLVYVDEDPGMAERTTTAIASHTLGVHPSNRLFMNQVYGCVWSWL